MKKVILLAFVLAALSGCVVTPYGAQVALPAPVVTVDAYPGYYAPYYYAPGYYYAWPGYYGGYYHRYWHH